MPAFQSSYVVSARNLAGSSESQIDTTLPNGQLWWLTAPGAYNASPSAYYSSSTPSSDCATTAPAAFLSALVTDVLATSVDGKANLTVVIHGLGNSFTDAIGIYSHVGPALANDGYGGLLLGFDWASPPVTAWDFIDPKDLDAMYATTRANVNAMASGGNFTNFLALLSSLGAKVQAAGSTLTVNVICHSEGNYVLQQCFTSSTVANVDLGEAILAAADINNGALIFDPPANTFPGSGSALTTVSGFKLATVYYSSGDDVLPLSESVLSQYHVPQYPGRLGSEGPAILASWGTLTPSLPENVYGVDCSAVINDANPQLSLESQTLATSHSLYWYAAETLADWALVLSGLEVNYATRSGNKTNVSLFVLLPTTKSIPPSSAAAREAITARVPG